MSIKSLILSILISICLLIITGCPLYETGEHPDLKTDHLITFTVEGNIFQPKLEFYSPASITIDYNDGSIVNVNGSAGIWLPENHTYADGVVVHNPTLFVSPWSALKVINLGYRATDGGNDTAGNGLDLIELHPTEPNNGGAEWSLWIQSHVGTVTAITGLSSAPELYALCFDNQNIDEIDLSGCTKLKTLEAYSSKIKKTNFTGCTNLVRCSIEDTGARYSWRFIGGSRVEEPSLDLSDCIGLRDIRGSADDHDILKLNPGALGTLWHLCKWGNPHFTHVQIGSESPQKLDVSRFTALTQLWVGGSPVIGDLVINNGTTYSVWGNNCGITSVDCHDQTQLRQLQLSGDPITSINITGCSNLNELTLDSNLLSEANINTFVSTIETIGSLRILRLNCGLTQNQIDRILTAFNNLSVTDTIYSWESFVLDLSGANNAFPSSAGIIQATSLGAKELTAIDGNIMHWTVTVNP